MGFGTCHEPPAHDSVWLMAIRRFVGVLVIVLLAGCAPRPASPSAGASATTTAAASATPLARDFTPRELPASGRLEAGVYTRAAFEPPITFELDDGWVVGTIATGFFDVQQQPGSPDVIAVQFANVEAVVGADGRRVDVTSAQEAAAAVTRNPALTILGESDSRLGGLVGFTIEVENGGDVHAGVLDVPPGLLGIDPSRRLWISLFDTGEGVLAVLVGGSVARWDAALQEAEPVLESVVIGH